METLRGNVINTLDALRRPCEMEAGRPMVLSFPSDIKVEPSLDDLKLLYKRLASWTGYLGSQEGRMRTDPGLVPEEYGGKCRLIAIDRDSFPMIADESRARLVQNTGRLGTVQQMVDEVADPTMIPPIFIKIETNRYPGDDRIFGIRDGNHRMVEVSARDDIPYILAYVRHDDLHYLDEEGVIYSPVVSSTDYVLAGGQVQDVWKK